MDEKNTVFSVSNSNIDVTRWISFNNCRWNTDKVNFYGPGLPWIIVQKLTKEIIYEAIKAYIDDKPEGYWLKLYHFAPNMNIAVFNQIQKIG